MCKFTEGLKVDLVPITLFNEKIIITIIIIDIIYEQKKIVSLFVNACSGFSHLDSKGKNVYGHLILFKHDWDVQVLDTHSSSNGSVNTESNKIKHKKDSEKYSFIFTQNIVHWNVNLPKINSIYTSKPQSCMQDNNKGS